MGESDGRTRLLVCAKATSLVPSLVVGLIGLTGTPSYAAPLDSETATSGAEVTAFEKRVITLINAKRTARGIPALGKAPCVRGFADTWATHLDAVDGFVHSNLLALLGLCGGTYAAENIALVYDGTSPRQLVKLWMDSPGHRANILNRRINRGAISLVYDESRECWLAVHAFTKK